MMAVVNAGELVTCSGPSESDLSKLGIIEDGALLSKGGKVAWVGTTKDFRRKVFSKPKKPVDAEGGLVAPGLVDPHTHLIFAGSREDELERKARGETYTSILQSGGGILRTISETRASSIRRIVEESLERIGQLGRGGVTTVEVKTGYGGTLKEEAKLLGVIEAIRRKSPVELVPTFLGLHATPPGFSRTEYVEYAVREMLPAIARLRTRPEFSDCFCETGVFSREDCSRYLRASRELGFSTKIHADEFSDSGGASLAAETKCTSADHLGYCSREGMEKLGAGGVMAVLLPTTSLNSGARFADARALVRAGCAVALGTDLSPNSWVESPQVVMGLACSSLHMTPAEALLGFTANAARALRRSDIGSLGVGCNADLVVYSFPRHQFLPYRIGGRYAKYVFKRGGLAYPAPTA